ncbi:hypothetical protein ACGF3G_41285 [Streptomyces sp. NPDC048179]|uniref:hypothetical protein n=1 Tax=Streptomyces sp. NPDC048179 TaxID=3365506 RepID=UPI00371A015E
MRVKVQTAPLSLFRLIAPTATALPSYDRETPFVNPKRSPATPSGACSSLPLLQPSAVLSYTKTEPWLS